MRIISRYYLLQLKNYLHQIGWKVKIEITILLGIYFSFFTEKLTHYFGYLLTEPNITHLGLSFFLQHLLLALFSFTTPFIYLHLLPKQKGLYILAVQPVSQGAVLGLLLVYYWKYQIILMALIIPIFIALLISTDLLSTLIFTMGVILYPIVYLLLVHLIAYQFRNKIKILSVYFSLQILYFTIFALLYINESYYLIYHILTFLLVCIFIYTQWKKIWMHWDTIIQQILPTQTKAHTSWPNVTYFNIPKVLPGKIHPLFVREFLSHLRNKNYLRIKILGMALLIMLLIIIESYFLENYKSIFMAVCLGFIWYHYSNAFNEKYIFSENKTFLKTIPFHYFHLWMAKFLSEFLYILVFLFIVTSALLIHGSPNYEVFQVVSILLIFSIIVLATITIFRILFHDNPRTAGYAYHFIIIFFLIMIASQFYLVGPILMVSLLLYFSYLSYRQFVQ